MSKRLVLKKAEDLQAQQSRREFLDRLSTIELGELALDQKMAYVIAGLNYGYSVKRMRRMMEISDYMFDKWREDKVNEKVLQKAKARGELQFERVVLEAGRDDPQMAKNILDKRDRAEERKKDREAQQKTTKQLEGLSTLFKLQGEERGVVHEGEIIEDVPDEFK